MLSQSMQAASGNCVTSKTFTETAAGTGAAEPIEAEPEMLTQPTYTESEDAGSEQTGSTQAESARAEAEDMIEAVPDVAEINEETQQDNEGELCRLAYLSGIQ